MVIPKITSKDYRSAYKYGKHVRQMIDANDYGRYKKHAHTKRYINDCIKHSYTSNQIKIATNYKVNYTKGKASKYQVHVESFDDIPAPMFNMAGRIHRDWYNTDGADAPAPVGDRFSKEFRQWVEQGKVSIPKRRTESIERHLTASAHYDRDNLIYYTSDPCKLYNLLCLDFDYVPKQDIAVIISFLSRIFPDSYYEPTKKGMHYYIKLKYTPFDVIELLDDYHYTEKVAIYRNTLCYLLTTALDTHLDNLDRPKGTCGVYNYSGELLKCGDLCSLPACSTFDEYNRFYNAPAYDEHYIACVINWLNCMHCDYGDIYTVDSIKDAINTYTGQVNNYIFPINQKYTDALDAIMFGADPVPEYEEDEPVEIPLKSTNDVHSEHITIMVKGSAGVVGSINGNDSQYNELQFISSYIRTYYKEHEAIPDEEQVYTAYLQQTGYSKLDADRRKRFSNNYAYVVSTFKPELTKSISYELGEYIHLITQTDEELTEWCRSNTCYESNIYQIDADLALGYIYTCSLNKMNKSRNRAVKRLTKIEGISKEQAQERLKNTCSVNGMHEWFEFKIKEHGIYEVKKIRTCNRAKAGALFELLLYLNLIECEYDDYSTGVARKYKLKDAG